MAMTLQRPVESYDGTDLSVAGRLAFWLVEGLDDGFEVRGTDTIIPGTAGRVARNRVRDRRVIVIEGWVKGVGADDAARATDFRSLMDTLSALFSPSRAAATLVVAMETGATRSISARPLPGHMVDYKPVPAAEVSFKLEAVGADWA